MKTGNHILVKFHNAQVWETFKRGTRVVPSRVTEVSSYVVGSKMFDHSTYLSDHSFL